MKIIEVIVLPNGETKVQTKGYSGRECRKASKFVEAALGKIFEERLTDEFFQLPASQPIVTKSHSG
jgi:hypothetical protein